MGYQRAGNRLTGLNASFVPEQVEEELILREKRGNFF